MTSDVVDQRLQLEEALACLDCVPHGVLRIDGDGRIAYANATANHILADDDGLCCREGAVGASSPQDDARLQALFRWAGGVEGAPAVTPVMTVSRPSGQLSYQIRARGRAWMAGRARQVERGSRSSSMTLASPGLHARPASVRCIA